MIKFTVPPALIVTSWGVSWCWLRFIGETFGNLSSGGSVCQDPKLMVALAKGPLTGSCWRPPAACASGLADSGFVVRPSPATTLPAAAPFKRFLLLVLAMIILPGW